jgi:1-acyl-sn-glycerol-3-phosphate acyltransferase
MCVFPEGTIAREEHMGGFKSGIVMMSIMADADILPVYIAKRENRFKRQVVVIGEKINYKDFVSGPFPSIDDINNITKILLEKELELENKYLQSLKTK